MPVKTNPDDTYFHIITKVSANGPRAHHNTKLQHILVPHAKKIGNLAHNFCTRVTWIFSSCPVLWDSPPRWNLHPRVALKRAQKSTSRSSLYRAYMIPTYCNISSTISGKCVVHLPHTSLNIPCRALSIAARVIEAIAVVLPMVFFLRRLSDGARGLNTAMIRLIAVRISLDGDRRQR